MHATGTCYLELGSLWNGIYVVGSRGDIFVYVPPCSYWSLRRANVTAVHRKERGKQRRKRNLT